MDQLESSRRLGGRNTSPSPARKKAVGVTPITRATKQVYQVAFSYKGVQCREIIDLPHTKANETYCTRLRAEVLGRIARNDFVYTDYFPESKRASQFGLSVSSGRIRDALLAYQERIGKTLEPSTYKVYRNDINNTLLPWVDNLKFTELSRQHIREFASKQTFSLKRLRNLLLPLRNVFAEAVADGTIESSPFDGLDLSRLVSPAQRTTDYAPDPYTMVEIDALLHALDEMERWTFQLWLFTGLRTSELVGLRWRNADTVRGVLKIREVTTVNQDKSRTKTPSGMRDIPLLPAALQALKGLEQLRKPGVDRVTYNPRGRRQDPFWNPNHLARVWANAHAKVKVRPRNPYMCRHTFASQLLSQGENIAYISKLLGHKDVEMAIRVYAQWVSEGEQLGGKKTERGYGMLEFDYVSVFPGGQQPG